MVVTVKFLAEAECNFSQNLYETGMKLCGKFYCLHWATFIIIFYWKFENVMNNITFKYPKTISRVYNYVVVCL